MSLTIDLTPEEQRKLEEAARREGLEPTRYARWALFEHVTPETGYVQRTSGEDIRRPDVLSAAEIIRDLDELAENNRDLPGLPAEAFDRETLYEDRL